MKISLGVYAVTFPHWKVNSVVIFDFPGHQYVSQPSRWAYQIKKKKNVACEYFYWHNDFSPVLLHLGKLAG